VFSAGLVRDRTLKVTTANAQGEKYLTDVIELLVATSTRLARTPSLIRGSSPGSTTARNCPLQALASTR
jgi:hypothetical protein